MSAAKSFVSKLVPLDLWTGLRRTASYLFKKKFTVQYPEKRVTPSDRFRGMFGYDPERCIICRLCAQACPVGIIFIEDHKEKDPETGKSKRVLDRYDIDLKRCMFCGLCEEACPTKPKSIWLTTKTYEMASYERVSSLYFTKEKLVNWEGVVPFPGVKKPSEKGEEVEGEG